jgi:hypothetical protein
MLQTIKISIFQVMTSMKFFDIFDERSAKMSAEVIDQLSSLEVSSQKKLDLFYENS